jgi:hypothetical protein
MSAAQRIAAMDELPARDLVARTDATLRALIDAMNQETTLLRAGRHRDATALTAEKMRLAQDYVGLSRSIQRQLDRLRLEDPAGVSALKIGHEQLVTQMAENLKVIATARAVTEDLLTDVARQVGRGGAPTTYGVTGTVGGSAPLTGGIAVNRSL